MANDVRPDRSHERLVDIGKGRCPGSSAVGRLMGLAALRGMITAATQMTGHAVSARKVPFGPIARRA